VPQNARVFQFLFVLSFVAGGQVNLHIYFARFILDHVVLNKYILNNNTKVNYFIQSNKLNNSKTNKTERGH